MSNLPSPPTTWQEDFESNLEYHQRFLRAKLRFLRAELREESVQEALCQAAIMYASEWERHGKCTKHRYNIARTVLYRVKCGRSCTREVGTNCDTMDRTFRKTGPRRESYRCTIFGALRDAPARPEIPAGIGLDLASWLAQLSPAQREIAEEYMAGDAPAEIAKRHGVHIKTAQYWRRALADSFDEVCE